MFKLVSLLIATACLLTLPAHSRAFGPGPGPGMPPGPKALGLLFNEDQNRKLEELEKAHRAETRPLADRLRQERHALRLLIQGGAAKDKELRAQMARVAEAETTLAFQEAAFIRSVRALATEDQLARLDAAEARENQRHDRAREAARKAMEEADPAR